MTRYNVNNDKKEIETLINKSEKVLVWLSNQGKYIEVLKNEAINHIIAKSKNWYGKIELVLNDSRTLYVNDLTPSM